MSKNLNYKTKPIKIFYMYSVKPWEKYGLTEAAYLFIYTSGYNSAYQKVKNPYLKGNGSYKVWNKGRREAKLKY